MSESNIKKPGQLGNAAPAAGPQVDPDLPTPRRELRLGRSHDGWLALVVLLYSTVSFPLVIRNPLDVSVFLAMAALGALLVVVVLFLRALNVLSSGWAVVAAFTIWMLVGVFLQLMVLASASASV
jgi:hypothetical protein